MAKGPKTTKTTAPKKPSAKPAPAAPKKPKESKAPKESKTTKKPKAEKAPRAAVRSEINAEDKALFLQHLPKIADLKAKLNTANANLRNAYKKAKAEGFHKADFDDAFEMQTGDGEKKRKSAMMRSLTIARWLGLDLGEQLDMFAEPSRVPAADRAYSEGESASMLGKSANPPYDPSTEQHREFMRGYHDHQAARVKDGIKQLDGSSTLITKEEKEAAIAEKEKAKETAEAGHPHQTSGVPMTRAQFKAQQQSGGGGGPRAEAEKMFKKAAAPAT